MFFGIKRKDVFIINELLRALLEMCGASYTEPLVLHFHYLHEAAKAVLTVKLSNIEVLCSSQTNLDDGSKVYIIPIRNAIETNNCIDAVLS